MKYFINLTKKGESMAIKNDWIKSPRKLSDFGVEVEKGLAQKRATKTDLARAIGIKSNQLSAIMAGDRPGIEYIEPICDLLGIEYRRNEVKTLKQLEKSLQKLDQEKHNVVFINKVPYYIRRLDSTDTEEYMKKVALNE